MHTSHITHLIINTIVAVFMLAKGYIKLARYGDTKEGEPCGLDINPADGNGCKGGPATVKVCGQNGMLFDAIYPTVG